MKLVIEIPNSLYANLSKIEYGTNASKRLLDCIKNGTPLPKGHWIEVDNGYICSECDIIRAKGTTGKYKYCPNCGARMESEDKE